MAGRLSPRTRVVVGRLLAVFAAIAAVCGLALGGPWSQPAAMSLRLAGPVAHSTDLAPGVAFEFGLWSVRPLVMPTSAIRFYLLDDDGRVVPSGLITAAYDRHPDLIHAYKLVGRTPVYHPQISLNPNAVVAGQRLHLVCVARPYRIAASASFTVDADAFRGRAKPISVSEQESRRGAPLSVHVAGPIDRAGRLPVELAGGLLPASGGTAGAIRDCDFYLLDKSGTDISESLQTGGPPVQKVTGASVEHPTPCAMWLDTTNLTAGRRVLVVAVRKDQSAGAQAGWVTVPAKGTNTEAKTGLP